MKNNEINNNVYEFASYPEALEQLVTRLRARKFDPDEYHVVLTPDRYTQSVELALFSGSGAIDLEVLTLSRLSRRVAEGGKALSREGGVMLTAQAIAAVEPQLTYYKRAAKYPDFARDVYDTMQQLCASVADAELLKAQHTATNSKLADLALIRAEYVKRKGEYIDSPDRLIELIAAIPESELVRNAHFYAIGYSLGYDTTRLNRRVFDALKKNAKSFEYYCAAPPTTVRKDMQLFRAPDRAAQYKYVAMRIHEYICRGGAADDVSIICPEPRALARILREYDIDFYHDESTPLYSTPIVSALENIYKLRVGYGEDKPVDSQALVALCKNPFSGCNDGDAQVLQNRAQKHARFIPMNTDFKDVRAVRAADRARQLVEKFDGDFASAVRAVAEYADFENVQRTVFDGCTDTVAPMLALVDLLEKYGSGELESDAKSFFAAARAVEIKSVPRFKNRVAITMPNALRMKKCKLLVITDFNEGVLPTAVSDSGLLCDDEITEINALCDPQRIEPTVREQNKRERIELAAVVRNADEVVCTYVTTGRPSAFVYELAEDIEKLSHLESMSTLKNTDDPQLIAYHACVTPAARELAARGLTKHSASLVEAVGVSDHTAAPFAPIIAGSGNDRVSVSELSNYFKCPYKRFLHDAVGLTDRRTSALAAPDFGTLMHDFMKALVDEGIENGYYDCSSDTVKRLIDEAIQKKELYVDPQAYARLLADAEEFAAVNVKIITSGEYEPLVTEKPFGGKTLGSHGVEFTGIIDRLDCCDGEYRIVDYKTGSTEFKPKSCYDGTDMQLPLYAYAVGVDNVTGFFYIKLTQRYENKRPMHGRMVEEVEYAEDYDMNLVPGGAPSELMSVRLGKDKDTGDIKFDGRYKTQMPRDEFYALVNRCVATAGGGADEIAEGYIERTPIPRLCETCSYFGVCGKHKVPRGSEDGDESAEE